MKLNDIINDYHIGMSFRGGIIGGTTIINNISYVLIVGKSIKQHTFDYTLLNTTDNDGYTNTNNNHVFKKIINEYHHSGYNDWYIPSIEELLSIELNTLSNKKYWSSSQKDKHNLYGCNINSPINQYYDKQEQHYILPLRREMFGYNQLHSSHRQHQPVDV